MFSLDLPVTDDAVGNLVELLVHRRHYDALTVQYTSTTWLYHDTPYAYHWETKPLRRSLYARLTSIDHERALELATMLSICPHLETIEETVLPGPYYTLSQPPTYTRCAICFAYQDSDRSYSLAAKNPH